MTTKILGTSPSSTWTCCEHLSIGTKCGDRDCGMFHCQVMQASAEKNTTYRLRSRLTMVGLADLTVKRFSECVRHDPNRSSFRWCQPSAATKNKKAIYREFSTRRSEVSAAAHRPIFKIPGLGFQSGINQHALCAVCQSLDSSSPTDLTCWCPAVR